jgi:thiol-disulfide isomerase/thioredoxin
MDEALGAEVEDASGAAVPVSALAPVVGLYFGASWCTPCRQALPALLSAAAAARAAGHGLDIVYVSNDKDQEEFDEYRGHMPDWYAVPFSDAERLAALAHRYELQAIPALVLLDRDGVVLTQHGRQALTEAPSAYPWRGYAPAGAASAAAAAAEPGALAPNNWQVAAIVALLAWWALSGAALL